MEKQEVTCCRCRTAVVVVVSPVIMFFFVQIYVTKPNSACTRRQTGRLYLYKERIVRSVSLSHGGIARPTLLRMRGRRRRRSSAGHVLQRY